MKRESKNKTLILWIEELWEEVEIQFYGITFAIFVFILIYFIFHPSWMKPLLESFSRFKLSL